MLIQKAGYILVLSGLAFLFFLSGIVTPLFGIFIFPFSSAALLLLFLKEGALSGFLGIILSAALVYFSPYLGIGFIPVFLLFPVLSAVIFYAGLSRKDRKIKILMRSFLIISGISLVFLVLLASGGFQFSSLLENVSSGIRRESFVLMADIFERYVYAFIVMSTGIYVLLSYVYAEHFACRIGVKTGKLPFSYLWRLPEWFIFVFIFSLAGYVSANIFKADLPILIAENLLFVVSSAYFISGITIVSFFFKNVKLMRFVTYMFFFLYPPAAMLIGLTDVWLDFRKKKGDDNESDNKERC
ncbi:MAG: hypothetical protein BWY26_00724 [Elusimicrobia bacterium ADurb.Bin231]|nr:MAG: hypothetical protein BWY26_00724 [Elusimicrobia bacterium ADurb.Bin231]